MTVSSPGLNTELAAARHCDLLSEGEAQRRVRVARRAALRQHRDPSAAFGRARAAAAPMRVVSAIRRALLLRTDGSLQPQNVSAR
jgi:hypothetical protein